MGTPVVLPNGQKLETAGRFTSEVVKRWLYKGGECSLLELYCLVTQFLEQSPCRRAAEVIFFEFMRRERLRMTAETIAGNFLMLVYFSRAGVEGRTFQFEGRCNRGAYYLL